MEYASVFIPDRCIGCRACQTACKIWNQRPVEKTSFSPDFTNPPSLTPDSFTIIKFKEVFDGEVKWIMLKEQCMHCNDPPCVSACPTGAMTKTEEGAVYVRPEKCIGCQYCVEACPFDVPKYDEGSGKVYKCTMCIDRIRDGKLPACVEACPTQALVFGKKDEVIQKLKSEGFEIYGERLPNVGGTHWLYATKEFKGKLTDPKYFGLPESPAAKEGALPAIREFGVGVAGLAILASLLHAAYWRAKKEESK
ncbi:formate dehydrogenase subunit beta [Ignicoccus pacificus DSM 13166]|uniref:Formate dehydrogenase subunit beta n=1 Tax=Ignicoccus pacificus DSM 13166 TaxID=940294 RepID=A0A977K9W6_9CREN|nr:formate dehydrogenase subunit beta [Ignicoccus pacificus DSM 13166]